MKILCMIPVYKRPELLKVCIDGLKRNKPPYAEIIPFFIISEEDKHFKINYNLVKKYHYLVYKNNPLGEKKNAGLRHALKLEWDYFMDMGSDNVYTHLLWQYYEPFFTQKVPFFGLKNVYFYNLYTDEAILVKNYGLDHNDKPFAVGVARMIHRDVIESIGDPWRSYFNSGMDGISRYKIIDSGYEETLVETNDDPVVLDIKGAVSINLYTSVYDMRSKEVDGGWIRDVFGLDNLTPNVGLLTFDGFHKEVISKDLNVKDAFNQVNQVFRSTFGVDKYKNYDSYRRSVRYNYGKDDIR